MGQGPECPRCGEIETLKHKFIVCDYIKRIWKVALTHTRAITTSNPLNLDPIEAALGFYPDANQAILTLNAEILQRINVLRQEDYLFHPKFFVKSAVHSILQIERKGLCRDLIKSISDSLAEQG